MRPKGVAKEAPMKYNVYKSCNCDTCRRWTPSKIKGEHKRRAHRELRRTMRKLVDRLVRYDDDTQVMVPVISTGYKS